MFWTSCLRGPRLFCPLQFSPIAIGLFLYNSVTNNVNPSGSREGEVRATNMDLTCYSLREDVGVRSVVYTTEQSLALFLRLMGSQVKLVRLINGSIREVRGSYSCS